MTGKTRVLLPLRVYRTLTDCSDQRRVDELEPFQGCRVFVLCTVCFLSFLSLPPHTARPQPLLGFATPGQHEEGKKREERTEKRDKKVVTGGSSPAWTWLDLDGWISLLSSFAWPAIMLTQAHWFRHGLVSSLPAPPLPIPSRGCMGLFPIPPPAGASTGSSVWTLHIGPLQCQLYRPRTFLGDV